MVSQALLLQAAKSFEFDARTLVFLSSSCNEVYRFVKNNQPYILRLSERPSSYVAQIQAEVDWVCYLAQNGVRAALPVHTPDGRLTAVYRHHEQCLIATAFHTAPGRFFDKNNPQLWGPPIFRKWGEAMGQMHLLAKSYSAPDASVRRMDWETRSIDNPSLHQGRYLLLLERLRTLENTIAALPKNIGSYGLIHNDFHPYNFHIDNGDITVFDFDDSLYGWYALDIAIAATHAVWWGSPADERQSKNEFARRFLDEFLTGYSRHNILSDNWLKQIPMFMDYRNISSYFWWLGSWNGDERRLTEAQQAALAHAVTLISKGQRFAGCDISL